MYYFESKYKEVVEEVFNDLINELNSIIVNEHNKEIRKGLIIVLRLLHEKRLNYLKNNKI